MPEEAEEEAVVVSRAPPKWGRSWGRREPEIQQIRWFFMTSLKRWIPRWQQIDTMHLVIIDVWPYDIALLKRMLAAYGRIILQTENTVLTSCQNVA